MENQEMVEVLNKQVKKMEELMDMNRNSHSQFE